MVSAGDFKNGLTVEIEGTVYQILEFQHVKPGKGAAFVRTKLKNIINGGVVEKTFRPTEKFENAHIDRKEMQYLYNDGDLYYFMDTDVYKRQAQRHLSKQARMRSKSGSGQGLSVRPESSPVLAFLRSRPLWIAMRRQISMAFRSLPMAGSSIPET